MDIKPQIKSRDRVRDKGEVFTEFREVNAMLNLVKNETLRIDSRFFEPACGDGNFLVEILKRKLDVVKNKYSKNINEFEKYSIIAFASIYGVDIMADNIEQCAIRLYEIWKEMYITLYGVNPDIDISKSVKFILLRNIIQGDALTMRTIDGERIVVSEWSLIAVNKIQRSDFYLDKLLNSPLKVKSVRKNKIYYIENKEEEEKPHEEFIIKKISFFRKIHEAE